MSISIELSTKNFNEASKTDGNNEFTFIIGDQTISCHKFVASFLSHSVSQLILSDPTSNSFTINSDFNKSEEQKQIWIMIKNYLQQLILGQNIEIKEEDLQQFSEELLKITKLSKLNDLSATKILSLLILFQSLNNDELKEQLYIRLLSFISSKDNHASEEPKKYTKEEIENKIKLIQKVENFFNITEANKSKENFFICVKKYLEKEFNEIIDVIASNFFLLDENDCNEVSNFLIDSILSSSKLQIKSEDSLLELLLNRRSYILSQNENIENNSHFFIEKVRFEYLTENSMKRFLDEIRFDEIGQNVWCSIKKRLLLPVQMNSEKNERCNSNYLNTFLYNSENPFNGIFQHLIEKANGNIQSNGTIEIKSSNKCCGKFEDVVDFNKQNGFVHVNSSPSPRWLQVDFKSRKILLDSYLIKSHNTRDYGNSTHLKSFQIEVSVDGSKWDMIDNQENVSELNGNDKMKLFKIKKKHQPFRFIRIITSVDSWDNINNGFLIKNLELFRQIIE